MGRTPCCDRASVKRGPWSAEEDEALRSYVQRHGSGGNWIALPRKAGLRRCGKSCRLRWLNYLRPDIRHGAFSAHEDALIFSLYAQLGSKWSVIASQMQGRTDNDVKNHWNTKLKKRLLLAAATSSSPPPVPSPAPASTNTAAHASTTLFPALGIPTVKTEAYTCDDDDFLLAPAAVAGALMGDPFFAAADGSTSAVSGSAASSASNNSNWSAADNGAEGSFFLLDFCAAAGSDDLAGAAAAAEQDQLRQLLLPGGYYYPLDPSCLSLV